MAVLKSWYVILFFFITQFLYQSNGDDTEEIEKSKSTLLSIRGLATGYPVNQNPYDGQSLSNWSLVDFQIEIDELYKRLECGYLFSTQLHIKLTNDAVFQTVKKGAKPETIEAFLFEKEASTMIDSLLEPKQGRVNELWLIYIYACQMRLLIDQIASGRGQINSNILNQKKQMANYVQSVINKRIKNIRCAPENYFDMKSKECNHWCLMDEEPQIKQDSFSKSKRPNNDDVMTALQVNKTLLRDNFRENQYSMSDSFPQGFMLLFPNKNAFNLFIKKFVAADSDRFEVEFPGFEYENNFRAVKPLGEYQHQVIGTLEIIMLQVILSYTNRLSESGNYKKDVNEFNFEILAPYRTLMMLDHDMYFNQIYFRFLTCHNALTECRSFLNRAIVELISQIMSNHNLPQIKSIAFDSDKSLEEVFTVGKELIHGIKNVIGERSIRLVRSFLKMVDDIPVFAFKTLL